jgi:hypothetical protein
VLAQAHRKQTAAKGSEHLAKRQPVAGPVGFAQAPLLNAQRPDATKVFWVNQRIAIAAGRWRMANESLQERHKAQSHNANKSGCS